MDAFQPIPSASAPSGWTGRRESLRDTALRNAMVKRAAGVPTYSVPEAAALLSISQEYLYRLIQADGFPALRMRLSGSQGRYVVPAKAIEQLLNTATSTCSSVEVSDWAADWSASANGGAA
jgi:excisionase family DNA binding protein